MSIPPHSRRRVLFSHLLAAAAFSSSRVQAADPATPAIPPKPLKVGELTVVDHVRLLAAPKREAALVGGKLAGSNVSAREGYESLGEIKSAPAASEWTDLALPHTKAYRWFRYEAPAGSHGGVAELEFYSGGLKLKAPTFGSPGGAWKGALDGKPETFWNSIAADGQFAGLDLEEQASVAKPGFAPNGREFAAPQLVELSSRTPGATIRYTLDGTLPTAANGHVYTAPIPVEKIATITAVASKEGVAPSPAGTAVYWIGQQRPPMHSFHVGNSLTGNASRLPGFIRTAGATDLFPSYLIGGSTTLRLWEGKETDQKANWERAWAAAQHPLDYFTMQPRDFDVAREADYCTRFIKVVCAKSPEVQPWLYAEWVERPRARPTDQGKVPSREMKTTFPALTWQESMSAMMLYNEEVQRQILAGYHEGKPVRIIPCALAMGWARTLLERGEIPGASPGEDNFYGLLFDDSVHVSANGCYLVDLVWFATLYRESPEGKVLPVGTTLTAAQATVLQRLAWDVASNYPDCGLYQEGTQPCSTPEMVNDGKVITLKSATAGAWFRYTLDGTSPTRTNGYIYCGAISVQPGIKVKAVAYKSGMADSAVVGAP